MDAVTTSAGIVIPTTIRLPTIPATPSLTNVYTVRRGIIRIYPIPACSSVSQLGLTLQIDEDATIPFICTDGRQTPLFSRFSTVSPIPTIASLKNVRTWSTGMLTCLEAYLCLNRNTDDCELAQFPNSDDPMNFPNTEFQRIVPEELRDHLIIITPPLWSAFPTLYPPSMNPAPRVWLDPEQTAQEVLIRRQYAYPEVRIPLYASGLVGRKRANLGDIIFHKETAYYLTMDIGELAPTTPTDSDIIVMEARQCDQTHVLMFIPRCYLVPPQEFAAVIGKTEESEEEEDREEKRRSGL